jgi:FtsP/CotA-like multicopper oxidase with cupredoxin domain
MQQFLFLLLLYPAIVLSWQPDLILRVSNDTIAADCTARRSTVVNGTSPGPTIRVKEGDHVWIRVYNDMVDSNTTMHWQ